MSEIQNVLARELLRRARDFMQQEEYSEVIAYATAALEVMFNYIKQNGVRSSADLNDINICYYLGINIESYVRYRKRVGYYSPNASGREIHKVSGLFFQRIKDEFDKKDAEASLDYCTKIIINIEKTLERFNKPFSEE
ncbi:hypothetical protein QUB70_23520 [Microcoleus sp. A003_D6]